jgi:hypothetical protein
VLILPHTFDAINEAALARREWLGAAKRQANPGCHADVQPWPAGHDQIRCPAPEDPMFIPRAFAEHVGSPARNWSQIMKRSFLVGLLAALGATMSVAFSANAANLKSPDTVKNSLRILAYVQDDMARKLPTKSYSRLPHENQEFQEAAVPMRASVANEPPEFKAKVDALLKKAQAAGDNVAAVSATNDDKQIAAAVQAVADVLNQLYALFPEDLRPVPGQLGAGPGRGGPPPNLR